MVNYLHEDTIILPPYGAFHNTLDNTPLGFPGQGANGHQTFLLDLVCYPGKTRFH